MTEPDQKPRKKAGLKVWVLRIGLLIFSPLLALLLVELIWQLIGDPRHADYEEWLATRTPHFRLAQLGLLRSDPDPEISFTLKPGFEATVAGNRYRIDANGFRGAEVTAEKPADVKRVLILGDSYAFGFGVAEKDTISGQLQPLLAQKHPGVQVLNLGVPGYQTGQQERLLRRDALRFAPDVVVLVYYANDNMTPPHLYDPRVKTLYSDVLPLPDGMKRILARSILYSRITKAYTASLSPAEGEDPGIKELDSRGPWHWPETSSRIERVATLCEERKIGFVIVAIPALVDSIVFLDRTNIYNRDHDRVLEFAGAKRIGIVDVRDLLLKRGTPIEKFPIEQLFVSWDPKPRDSHFNPEGYGILARALATHIETNQLLR